MVYDNTPLDLHLACMFLVGLFGKTHIHSWMPNSRTSAPIEGYSMSIAQRESYRTKLNDILCAMPERYR